MSQTKAQLVGGVGFSTADSLTVHNGLAVTGVVTATSFVGNGSGLTGVANTGFINAEQVTVVGVVTATTFDGNLTGNVTGNVIGNVTGNVTGTANLASGITGVPGIAVGIITATSAALTDNISAASGTFTGNVTVGGTLTYDDVTNVDSIGVVTARTGVQFGLAGVGGSVSGTGNANFAGIVTATSLDASIAFWTLGASGSNHYTFTGPGDLSGDTDPDLQLIRGQKYIFKNRSGGHPFRIQSTPNGSAGTAYNDGVTNNDAGNGTDLIFDVPFDAPSILYYQCTSHGSMGGRIYIGSSSGDDVNVGAAVTIYASSGIVSATSYFGSGANLTGINVAPSFTGIASGSISDGDPVVVLSSGLIEKVGPRNTNRGSYSAGSELNIDSTQSSYVATAYDTDKNKIMVAANDDNDSSGRVRAVTPQINGTYTSTAEYIYSTDDSIYNSLTYDSNANKTVVFYHDGGNSNRGTANVLNLASDNTITGGSDVVFSTLDTRYIDSVFDPDSNKIIVVYHVDNSGTNDVRCRVATVDPSDNSVSFGTEVTIKSNAAKPSVTYDTANNKVVVAYVDSGDSEKGKAVVGTVSGTDISFDTPVQFEADTTDEIRTVFSTDQGKVVIAYQNETDSNNIDMIAGTVSGTSINFGSVISATTTDDTEIDLFYHPQTFVIFLASRTGGSYGSAKLYGFTLSGTTLSASHSVTYRSAGTSYNSIQDFPDSERLHIFYRDGGGGTNLRANPVEVTSYGSNLLNNFSGIADAAYSDGQTVTVQTIGAVDDAQSGMTPGTPMYVSGQTGAITSTSSGNQFIGLAISATKLLIAKVGLDIT